MKNTNHSLFDKYEMIKDLGTGSSGSVTLVRHISMDQERALKKVPKSSAFAESALSEARLLKSLEHPSIPRIFDFEEDNAFYYIVEEYIDGETLDSFLLHQQLISPGLFFNICEQLCNVFIYLHTQISTPIIYRDLKPEHIIVCHNKLKLIDFGVSAYVIQDGNNFNHYGNIEFSAPECFTEDTITQAADIYSLGQLLQYILTFTPNSFSHKFQHIIQKATTSALRDCRRAISGNSGNSKINRSATSHTQNSSFRQSQRLRLHPRGRFTHLRTQYPWISWYLHRLSKKRTLPW